MLPKINRLSDNGAKVILASRTIEKGEVAKAQVLEQNTNSKIEVMEIELTDFDSIKRFARSFKEKHEQLHVLMNNAGIMTVPYDVKKDGFESQMGTNHLGHFALTGLLLDLIKSTADSRVVSVSSLAHKQANMDFDNLLFEDGKDYTPFKAYGRSKLANLLFIYELQRLFESNKINSIAVAAHPGLSLTNLGRHVEHKLMFRIFGPLLKALVQKADMGALSQIRAGVDPEVKGGQFYGPQKFMEISA